MAVFPRREEYRRSGAASTDDLHLDATNGSNLAGVVDRSGARDEFASSEVARRQLVVDPEGKHQPSAWAAHVVQLDIDGERPGVSHVGDDADLSNRRIVVRGPGRDRYVLTFARSRDRESDLVARLVFADLRAHLLGRAHWY